MLLDHDIRSKLDFSHLHFTIPVKIYIFVCPNKLDIFGKNYILYIWIEIEIVGVFVPVSDGNFQMLKTNSHDLKHLNTFKHGALILLAQIFFQASFVTP